MESKPDLETLEVSNLEKMLRSKRGEEETNGKLNQVYLS